MMLTLLKGLIIMPQRYENEEKVKKSSTILIERDVVRGAVVAHFLTYYHCNWVASIC